jgi:hypothetical protein
MLKYQGTGKGCEILFITDSEVDLENIMLLPIGSASKP